LFELVVLRTPGAEAPPGIIKIKLEIINGIFDGIINGNDDEIYY